MPDFPEILENPTRSSLHTADLLSQLLISTSLPSYTAWPAANKAFFLPFIIDEPAIAYLMTYSILSGTGNTQMGIYDLRGNKIVSASAAQPGAEARASQIDIADTPLPVGYYFMGMALDNTANVYAYTSANIPLELERVLGIQEMLSAYPLPATATFANPSTSRYIPMMQTLFK